MLYGQPEADTAAERITEHVDLFVAELLRQSVEVIAHGFEVELARAELGAAMPLQVDQDDLSLLGQGRQQRRKHIAGAEARRAGARAARPYRESRSNS